MVAVAGGLVWTVDGGEVVVGVGFEVEVVRRVEGIEVASCRWRSWA